MKLQTAFYRDRCLDTRLALGARTGGAGGGGAGRKFEMESQGATSSISSCASPLGGSEAAPMAGSAAPGRRTLSPHPAIITARTASDGSARQGAATAAAAAAATAAASAADAPFIACR